MCCEHSIDIFLVFFNRSGREISSLRFFSWNFPLFRPSSRLGTLLVRMSRRWGNEDDYFPDTWIVLLLLPTACLSQCNLSPCSGTSKGNRISHSHGGVCPRKQLGHPKRAGLLEWKGD